MPTSTTIRLLFLGRQAAFSQEFESAWQALRAAEATPVAPALRVFWVNSQVQALDALAVHQFNALVLEVDNQRQHRTRFSQDLRRRYPTLGIVAVSPEPLKAKRFAFDETIRLPLHPKTVENLMHLLGHKEETEVRFGRIHLNLATRTVQGPRGSHVLPPKLCALLHLMLTNGDEIISRKTIMGSVWETDYLKDTRTIDVHVRWLREKIEPNPSRPVHLLTARGQGFRLAAG
jgi:DNA-binding response OmpR family regulator